MQTEAPSHPLFLFAFLDSRCRRRHATRRSMRLRASQTPAALLVLKPVLVSPLLPQQVIDALKSQPDGTPDIVERIGDQGKQGPRPVALS